MFTGIVETTGEIQKIIDHKDCRELVILAGKKFDDLNIGDSLAVNGVCLTLTKIIPEKNLFFVTAVPETLRLTNLGKLCQNHAVNLERPVKANSRLGGHFVQGHIDAEGEITQIRPDGESALWVKIKIPPRLALYFIPKGFVTIDGMSITVIDAEPDYFTVTFIPHTIHETIVKNYTLHSTVNIETDMMGKYIQKLLQHQGLHAA